MNKKNKIAVFRPGWPLAKRIILAVLTAGILLIAVCGYGKDFFPNLLVSKTSSLPSAYFPHEDHMGFLDCMDCHHDYKNGSNELDEDELYEGNPDIQCASCHNGKKSFSLLRAFHRQCIQCHAAEKQGPVVCGECHTKS